MRTVLMVDDQDQTMLKHYLLDLVTDEERSQIEQRTMTDEAYYDELEAAEDDLIDEYVSGVLRGDERTRFEQHFLATAERQDNLRFARTLRRYVSGATSEQALKVPVVPPSWTWQSFQVRALAAVVVLIVVAGGVWFYRNRTAPGNFATLTLNISTATRAEGAQPTKIRIPSDVDGLKISLMVPAGYVSAAGSRVALLNEKGETSSLQLVRHDGERVEVIIPASRLARGQYALKLFKMNPDGSEQPLSGSYLFTVE